MAKSNDTLKILFFGDLVGKPGRLAVRKYLQKKYSNVSSDYLTFVIANVENASHGFGLTEKNYNELSEYGIDCMTSGNHIFDKKEIFNYIENAEKLVRPLNYPVGTAGVGSRVFELKDGVKVAVINLLGRVFMSPIDSQWSVIKNEVNRLKEITQIIIIDFHAEATAEKICFAKYCSELGVSAFIGTHTHVQTADEQVINNMGYITDAGFCGAQDSVIGMEYKTSLNRFTTAIPERYDVADGDVVQINAVEIEIDSKNGHTVAIKRIFILDNNKEKENEN